ncbi:MAG: hypothetical protein RLY16_1324 [Bacteroidota bacterium]
MEYNFNEIEQKWRAVWNEQRAYAVKADPAKPKFYVLDMFPYPSGAGLHVGHPLGYIASDIYSRFKRLKGFNVLHPMGFDSFGLPAEQYALEKGQHPAETTKVNIATFKSQLDKIGFCYDWEREVRTSDPSYFRWTQWIFLELYQHYFNDTLQKARPITELVELFATQGNPNPAIAAVPAFTAEDWNGYGEKEKEDILMEYRLCFSKFGEVNWCEALGTVLANDEVINGFSERGNHPVVKKKMRQWYLRITAYADRLLEGLERVQFSDSMKDMQRNWIGKSQGAEIKFAIKGNQQQLTVYTTRPDTIFGVDFMVVAPELDLVQQIQSADQAEAVADYIKYVKSRSEVNRMAEKKITGCFTGAYAINPFNQQEIPIYISEYVLAGYGTGAIMAVPCGDERDFKFARHFNIPITNIIGSYFNGEEANPTKEAILEASDFLNGMRMMDAMEVVLQKIEAAGIGKRKVNFKMRDAGFSRQRYWGEPFPIIWKGGIPVALSNEDLPLELPHVDKYGPGPEGEGPLANITTWTDLSDGRRETSTMPGYAGSSWYFLRYMDPNNANSFCDRAASDYWNQVDLYIGGTEHAVGHLLYSRMWTKVLFDLGHIGYDEPFKKLVNQGMITGRSYFMATQVDANENLAIVSFEKGTDYTGFVRLKFGHQFVENDGRLLKKIYERKIAEGLIEEALQPISWLGEGDEAYIVVKEESEKMSKSKFNVDNPDDLVDKYGADTFRMYEMFLGPVEQSKPWDTKGIEGVHRFLRKLWRLFNDELKGRVWTDATPTAAELKILHRTIKKIEDDTERFSFNTAVSTFMICVNELSDIKCNKKAILRPLLILLTPYAPHVAEELWHQLGESGSVLDAAYPIYDPSVLVETAKEYPVSVNGKMRTTIELSLDLDQQAVEQLVVQNETIQKWLEGKAPKKIIYVKNKMINIVV